MELSEKAQRILTEVTKEGSKLGDLRKIAKAIKKDHQLAQELWNTGKFMAMQLAILIFDTKSLTTDVVNELIRDIENYKGDEKLQLTDWLMANQLMKDKKLAAAILSWQNSPSPLKRRIFWYYQARMRWTGQTPPDNTAELLSAIDAKIKNEEPEVQWAMNFTAGWIGVFDRPHREFCIKMGEDAGLYKDEFVHKNCTPNYLPKFIEIEAAKRKL